MTANRPIKYFIVHCAFTKPSMDIGAKDIDRWHKKKGWKGIGYNIFYRRNGESEIGRSLEISGAHTLGFNNNSIGVCYAGGMSESGKVEDNITTEQMAAILDDFREAQKIHPGIQIGGHNQFNAKACPSLDMREYARKHGIEEESIYQGQLLVDL